MRLPRFRLRTLMIAVVVVTLLVWLHRTSQGGFAVAVALSCSTLFRLQGALIGERLGGISRNAIGWLAAVLGAALGFAVIWLALPYEGYIYDRESILAMSLFCGIPLRTFVAVIVLFVDRIIAYERIR